MMHGRLYFDQASSIRSQTGRMRGSPGCASSPATRRSPRTSFRKRCSLRSAAAAGTAPPPFGVRGLYPLREADRVPPGRDAPVSTIGRRQISTHPGPQGINLSHACDERPRVDPALMRIALLVGETSEYRQRACAIVAASRLNLPFPKAQ